RILSSSFMIDPTFTEGFAWTICHSAQRLRGRRTTDGLGRSASTGCRSCIPGSAGAGKAYARGGFLQFFYSAQEVSMRSALGVIVVIAAFATVPVAAQKDQTWKGAISDSKCNGKHPAGEHDGKKMTDEECTKV